MGSTYNPNRPPTSRTPREYHGERRRPEPPREEFQPPTDLEIRKIIAEGDVDLLVGVADKVGEALAKQKLTTSQMRNVYGTVRQIQMRWDSNPAEAYRSAVLLRPKLGYFAEREKGSKEHKTFGMESLQKVLEPALVLLSENNLSEPERKERFNRFVDLFEAIVAYHKKHGGK